MNFRLSGAWTDCLVTPAPSEWDGSFNRRKSDRVSPSRPVAPAANAEVRRVVLVESDQYYREVLTFELLCQGFVVHAFADGASLLGSLASVIDADLAVLDWDLPKMPGIKLMARTAPAWRQPARRVPDRQGHRRQRARAMPSRPAGSPECLRMHGVRPRRRRLHRQVTRQASPRQAAETRGRTRQAQDRRFGRGARGVRQAPAEAGNQPRLLEPGRCRPHARGIQNRQSAGVKRRLGT